VYGRNPATEAKVGSYAKKAGAECFVIDAEAEVEGKYAAASTYMRTLRKATGKNYPIGIAGFPYVDYHPGYPYSVFLGPGGAQFNVPQMYWKAIGVSVDRIYSHTYTYNEIWGRPIAPLGQTYMAPPRSQLLRFRDMASAYRTPGLSWWSWQSTTSSFQSGKHLKVTGRVDVPTWQKLLRLAPAKIQWSQTARTAKVTASGGTSPEPASAKLPALMYEIPPKKH
jgi:hypothetical protein